MFWVASFDNGKSKIIGDVSLNCSPSWYGFTHSHSRRIRIKSWMTGYWWTVFMFVPCLGLSGKGQEWGPRWSGVNMVCWLTPPPLPKGPSLPCWPAQPALLGMRREAGAPIGIQSARSAPARGLVFVVPLLTCGVDVLLVSVWETSRRIPGKASSAINNKMCKY